MSLALSFSVACSRAHDSGEPSTVERQRGNRELDVRPPRNVTSRTLLCVSNVPPSAGFAWDFIQALYAGLADRLTVYDVRTMVAYPTIDGPVAALDGSAAEDVELPFRLSQVMSLSRVARFVRRERVDALYLTDRPSWHPAYALLRAAHVGSIVVHDHTSGARTAPVGLKRLLKIARVRIPGMTADRIVAVSDFVARRKIEVDLLPRDRVHRVWNSVPVLEALDTSGPDIREPFGLQPDATVVACASRASQEKGIPVLLRAFDAVVESCPDRNIQLVYMGDGPRLGHLREEAAGLRHSRRVHLPGYVDGAAAMLASADVAVVPSVWAEAFGLAALEPMSRGVPVVASRVGGIPEVVRHEQEGLLVEPGDPAGMARAIVRLLRNPELRKELGRRGRDRARRHFSRDRQLDLLEAIFIEELGLRRKDDRSSGS